MTARRLIAILAAAMSTTSCAAQAVAATPAVTTPDRAAPVSDQPTLVVLIVIDQLGASLMQRYADLYRGGFRRLLDQGRVYMNASHNHGNTVTAVGHAALVTGVIPSRHGIAGNGWLEKSGGQWVLVSNVGDSTVRIVGHPDLAGVSPRNLLRPGFADWLLAANPRSQVASVSGKDRGAILSASRAKGQVYWFDGVAGKFVTSTYYRTANPAWVDSFNNSRLPPYRADSVWRSSLSPALLSRTKPDTVAEERDGVNTFFPHSARVETTPERFWEWFEQIPASDAATLDFAEQMVSSMSLGRDDAPDYLNVSLSATDIIGHVYGPHSREQLDNLMRLDGRLGKFFDYLDANVGRGKWVIAFSADHGVVDMPEDLVKRGEYGHRITTEERTVMAAIRARADSNASDPSAAKKAADEVKKLGFVANAWTYAELPAAAQRDTFALLTQRSVYRGRAATEFSRIGVEVLYKPGVLGVPKGSSHGSQYWYDRNVPMIFMGAGIAAGRDAAFVHTVDMAPTLARLLGIAPPGDLDGKPISAVTGR